jgi:C1A family cysteine protease
MGETMPSTLLEHARRLSIKQIVTDHDIKMYRPLSSGSFDLFLDDKPIRLPSHLILGPPRIEDVIAAESDPLFPSLDGSVVMSVGPDCVDHRPNQTPVRNQGERGSCVSFAALAQMEAKIKTDTHQEIDLSEQFAHWKFMKVGGRDQCAEIVLVSEVSFYLESHGVCVESLSPYESREDVEQHCSAGPSTAARQNAKYGILQHKPVSQQNLSNTDYVEAILSGGQDIVVGVEMAIIRPNEKGIFDVWLDATNRPFSLSRTDASPGNAPGHAMLLVGYNRKGPDPFFIFKNSWGEHRGDGGYFYISYDYFREYAKVGYIISGVRGDMPAEA